jgi:hypothetical protein
MKQATDIFLTTLIAILFAGLVTLLADLCFVASDSMGLLIILVIGNLFFPTLLAVLLFRFIKSISYPSNSLKGFITQSLLLLSILLLGLLMWSVFDVVFSDAKDASFFSRLLENFSTEFLGFIPATIAISFAIPPLDYLLSSKTKSFMK